MGNPVTINLRHVARGLNIPLPQIQAVVELLDEGNTVPFITRYRKDQSGGLDEVQIRQIQTRLTKMRLLAERKQTILRSIESQGKLTDKLAKQIHAAGTTKRLEDLYLPFKPRKQTLATLARTRGLETLAQEILAADPACADLDGRAADFVNTDRQLPTAADALLGAGHILAEQFSEKAELRQRLRDILQRTGKIVSTQVGGETKSTSEKQPPPKTPAVEQPPTEQPPTEQPPTEQPPTEQPPAEQPPAEQPPAEQPPAEQPPAEQPPAEQPAAEQPAAEQATDEQPAAEQPPAEQPAVEQPAVEQPSTEQPSTEQPSTEQLTAEPPAEPSLPGTDVPALEESQPQAPPEPPAQPEATAPAKSPAPAKPPTSPKPAKTERRLSKKELRKKKADEQKQKAFSDYFDYCEEIRKIPPHRILAINRGDRAKVLRVKVECDLDLMHQTITELCVPADHPHAEFLRGCARDALLRLILPSLEREIRRELTDRAETHAVDVFARNLRNLLLQPPIQDRRVLAVDPGFKSGCKLVALDQFGNVLDHGVIYLVGKPDRRQKARELVCGLIDRFQLSLVVIGNGTACRETENFFAELIGDQLKDRGVAYVIVNEAGASVYSTSRLGREEFPNYDATLRGAISIGRRLQDPLSELVKIDPASIGVGLYQHDVKAKHLRTSLDAVVESCVNYVGVDVNTASPALLRYVSGLNQLTARRLYEHRIQEGPFRSREQFKQVSGFGEATFVQSAGFLKIAAGENPFDTTWIHPESYELATRVMEKLDCPSESLLAKDASGLNEKVAAMDKAALATDFQVGELLLGDILAQLVRPGRDPREDLPGPIFKQGVLKIEDLEPGMQLNGTVLNVVDFGAFVDIGMHDSGLVHVSQLADKFVRDPHDVVAVGDIVKVWVLEVDKERRRVSLTMIEPGTRRAPPRRQGKPQTRTDGESSRSERKPRPQQDKPGKSTRSGKPRYSREKSHPPKPRHKPKSRPKPVTPITKNMKEGKEPMRSFSDLAQFFQPEGSTPAKSDGSTKKQQSVKPKKNRQKTEKPPAEPSKADEAVVEVPKADEAVIEVQKADEAVKTQGAQEPTASDAAPTKPDDQPQSIPDAPPPSEGTSTD